MFNDFINFVRKIYGTKIDIEVEARLIGNNNANETKPTIVRRENMVDVKIPRERSIMGDEPEFFTSTKNKTSYRD